MTLAGVLSIVLGLLLAAYFAVRFKSTVYFLLFLTHLTAAIFSWQYTLVAASDAYGYYAYPLETTAIGAGTWMVGWVVTTIRDLGDFTFVDMFMFYHLFGYVGIVLFARLTRSWLAYDLSKGMRFFVTMLPFIPGLHVWTSSIGKDSPMFLTINLFLWGSRKPTERLGWMIIAFILSSLIRPHVGAMMVIACVIALVMSDEISASSRFIFLALLIGGLAASTPFLKDYVGLETVSTDSLTSYVEARQGYNLSGGSSIDISEYPWPLQFFTYMYRPLFFDANSSLAAVVSMENAFYLLLTLLWGGGCLRILSKSEEGFYLRYNVIYWFFSVGVFAAITTNLGIAVRQKIMVVPSLLIALFTTRFKDLAFAHEVDDDDDEDEEADEEAEDSPFYARAREAE